MTQSAITPLSPPMNQAAHRARVLAQVAIPLLFAAIVLPLIGQIYLATFEAPANGGDKLTAVLIILLQAAPAFALAWTMLGVAKVLAEYEAGRLLSHTASKALRNVGFGGLVALLLNVVVVPLAVGALRGDVFAALNPDVFDLCVLMFAASMLTVGAVLEDATKTLKAENDQIV